MLSYLIASQGSNQILIKLIESRSEIDARRPTLPKTRQLEADISMGKERIPIPVINSVDDHPAPLQTFKEMIER